MSKFQKILDSFSLQETLNPKVWENYEDVEKATLKIEIRKKLLQIAEEFVDDLGDDIFVDDIVLMGSLANYNWSEFSDFDLHVLVDFEQYKNEADLYREIFDLKKKAFNNKHDIKIKGYDVEVYAQGTDDPHSSSAVYSLLNDEWIQRPKKENAEIDFDFLKKKVKGWISKIEDAVRSKDVDKMKSLKEKIKDYRKSGLEDKGEFSYENLVFKFLRRSEMIGKLFEAITKQKDKELSIEQKIQEQTEITDNKKELGKEVNDRLNSSNFLKDIMSHVEQKLTFEYTPGQKIPYEPEVKAIQTGLQFLGFALPKWGVDGKFGPETKKAVEEFQSNVGLPINGIFGIKEMKYLLANLIMKGFSDSDLSSIQYEKEIPSGLFSILNLDQQTDYEAYKEICQTFIDKRNPNSQVTGEMMTNCAKKYFSQGYVPPELALAQLVLEGGLSKDQNAKPIRTKNPFNVGNVDSGEVNVRPSFEDGVCMYYDLMTRRYLSKGKSAEDLLQNFVNAAGNRYASNPNYEEQLQSLAKSISSISKPILSNLGLSGTDLS